MIVLASIFSFLTLFFMSIAFSNAIRKDETEMAERIERRLKEEDAHGESEIRLEKKERFSDLPLLDRILRKFRDVYQLQTWIRQSGLPLSAGALLLVSLFLGVALWISATALNIATTPSIPAVSAVMGFPFVVIAFRRSQRIKKFSEIFPDAVARMASSLRAGYSLQKAFEAVTEDSVTLVAQEFKYVLAEMEVGQNFEQALKKMLERIDTPDLRLFISSVILQRESGGNLAALLDNLETTIRERFELQRELRSATAQAKLSGIVLSLLPLFVGFFVFLIHRDYILFLFEDPMGNRLLWLSVFGQCLGFFCIYKIIHIRM